MNDAGSNETGYIPGLGKTLPYRPDCQAVLEYRSDGGCDPHTDYYRKMSPTPNEFTDMLKPLHPLKNFQSQGVWNASEILLQYKGCIIADDMGLGKTIEAIVLSQSMGVQSLLIVVEAKTIIQWQQQYYKWTGELLTPILKKTQAAAIVGTQGGYCICTYDMLASLGVRAWDMVIYDEIQKLRSRSSKMSLAARELRNRATYVVGLTGTLQWGYRRDLWAPLVATFRYLFGSADQFDFTYCGAFINEHGGKDNKGHTSSDGADRSVELDIRLSYVSICRTRADVKAEMPSMERRVVRIPCTEKARIALHAYLRKELKYTNAIMSTTSEKTEPVLEILEGLTNAIVFTYTNADVVLLEALIEKSGKRVYTITGKVSKPERVAIIQRAAIDKATIVATIDSCGVGVDGLQHVSSNIIFHSLSHSPKLHLQAESRAHRIGQENPVVITYVVMQDSADELVIRILETKSQQDGSNGADVATSAFKSLAMDDASMQAVLDDWVKNATDEINSGENEHAVGWEDKDDDET